MIIKLVNQKINMKAVSRMLGIGYENTRAIYKIYTNQNRKSLKIKGR